MLGAALTMQFISRRGLEVILGSAARSQGKAGAVDCHEAAGIGIQVLMRWRTPIPRGVCTATSSRRTC